MDLIILPSPKYLDDGCTWPTIQVLIIHSKYTQPIKLSFLAPRDRKYFHKHTMFYPFYHDTNKRLNRPRASIQATFNC